MKIEITIPSFGESISEATVGQILVENGAVVAEDDPLFEMESDKASLELPSPASGKVELSIESGALLAIGQVVGTIDTDFKVQEKTLDKDGSSSSDKSSLDTAIKVDKAPDSKQLSKDSMDSIRIDRDQYLTKDLTDKSIATKKPVKQEMQSSSMEPSENIRREKMSGIRKAIAKRLVEVKQETAMLTTFNEVDLTRIIEIRKHHKESFEEKVGAKLSFMPFFVKACCQALGEVKSVNAMIEGDDIIYHNDVHMSLAVSTQKGLLVPVIKKCNTLNFAQTAIAIQDMAIKGREGKLTMNSMRGGTFTITNGGVFGSMLSTPILNPPQSAILGMHNIMKRAVVLDGQIVIRDMMYLALSYDHRIIDGKDSVGFLVTLKNILEHPEQMLLY